MAITFTLGTTASTNIINQQDISTSKSITLEVATLNDTINNSTDISLYNFEWYFIDKPTGTLASIDNSLHANKYQITLNSIDTWGTYRIFVIAKQAANESLYKSEENPLRAPEEHFINIIVKSTNNELEKPANFQRNWKDQYNKLVEIVDSNIKLINNIKVSNSLTFNLPVTDGTNGQILKTDGSGNLSFDSVSASELSNVSLESLTNVSNNSPTDGQVLAWDSSINSWKPETVSSSSDMSLESLSVGTPTSATTTGGISYNNSNGVFTYSPPDLSTFLTSFNIVDDTTPQLGGDLDGQSFDITTTGKILFSNVYSTEVDLPLASTYHGMFAHVHATGKAYFSHNGSWIKLASESDVPSTTSDITEGTNLYYTEQRASTVANLRIGAAKLQSLDQIKSDMSPTDGQVLKWDAGNSRWDAANDNSSGSSFSGLTESSNALTISNNYNLVPESTSTIDLGSDSLSFRSLWINDGDDSFNGGIFCDGDLFTNNITLGYYGNIDDIYNLPPSAGSTKLNQFLKLTTANNVNFSTISYDELTGKPTLGTSSSLDVGTGANNIVQLDSSGKLPAIDGSQLTGISGAGSATDNISEGNAKVETVDTGSDGSIDFYTEVSSDNSVFSSVPSPAWKMDENGNLTPGKNDTFKLGHYDPMGNSSDNRQISEIHVDKIYSNGNYFRIPSAMSSSDFKLTAVQDSMSFTYDIPFYASDASPSNSSTGHIIVKDLSESYGPHDWSAWKIKLPAVFSSNSNSVLVSNSSIDEFTWEKTDLYKTLEWSNSHSGEWTTATSFSSSYSGSLGKSIFIFAFKNITGKTINITKASLSCLEMYSTKLYWTLVGASDSDFKQNKGSSLVTEQTLVISNQENSSPYSGIGQSEVDLSQSISNGLWTAFLITGMTSSSNNNKNFVANLTYTLS